MLLLRLLLWRVLWCKGNMLALSKIRPDTAPRAELISEERALSTSLGCLHPKTPEFFTAGEEAVC